MIADAADFPLVVTAEDGVREGGVGDLIRDALQGHCTGRTMPCVDVLGLPVKFIPHGKPDRILAQLGLDADGLARAARDGLAALVK
jgi:1-deoxy-D-xylulose-5-phosphate synthase